MEPKFVAGQFLEFLRVQAEMTEVECASIAGSSVRILARAVAGDAPVPPVFFADYTALTKQAARRMVGKCHPMAAGKTPEALAFEFRGKLYGLIRDDTVTAKRLEVEAKKAAEKKNGTKSADKTETDR